MDMEIVLALINIMIIDLVLSGDNAVVIGMASRRLPENQRKKAILWGTVGAVFLRVSLTALTVWILMIPLLKAIGGILLLWIAFKLLIDDEKEVSTIQEGKNLAQAIKTIIVADFVMSLDNVLAVGGAAHGNVYLVLFGLGLSIPLLMWGSVLVARLMNRFPVLVYIGSGILAYTGGNMVIEDKLIQRWLPHPLSFLSWLVPVILMICILVAGKIRRKDSFSFTR
ncbi:TerC family protein [Microaerobacter geothermalis]|uniref:TerC family protein n=1 Tax=Microaerobacter geothermalis TaxID=674972 RepID=UPI001F2F6EBC|nr:TerC family protein [Microaerobacter geothermalis]MCF6094986.1 TerC family protein [Microaerobacter geothermalis]